MGQMLLFPDVAAAAATDTPAAPPLAEPVVVSSGAVDCECKAQATHLFKGTPYCEKCLVKALRGRGLLNKTAVVSVILRCADGFRRVRRRDIEDFSPLGESTTPRPKAGACDKQARS